MWTMTGWTGDGSKGFCMLNPGNLVQTYDDAWYQFFSPLVIKKTEI